MGGNDHNLQPNNPGKDDEKGENMQVKEICQKKLYYNRLRLTSPLQVQRLLSRTISGIMDDEISCEKARAIGYLARIMLESMESVQQDDRLTQLEKLGSML